MTAMEPAGLAPDTPAVSGRSEPAGGCGSLAGCRAPQPGSQWQRWRLLLGVAAGVAAATAGIYLICDQVWRRHPDCGLVDQVVIAAIGVLWGGVLGCVFLEIGPGGAARAAATSSKE